MITRRWIGTRLGQFSVGFTVSCWALAALAFSASRSPWLRGSSWIDYCLFGLVWSYILVTPVAATVALVVGDRTTRMVRATYGVLLLWSLFLIWTGTMTF